MSEAQAFKRIRVARATRRFPVVGTAVEEGGLHLTAVVRLAPHLTAHNVEALVAEASGKSKAEIEVLLHGGSASDHGATVLCRSHNQYEAERMTTSSPGSGAWA